MKGDIGMAKQVEQEAAYPIPIPLYNCYGTVRQNSKITYEQFLCEETKV